LPVNAKKIYFRRKTEADDLRDKFKDNASPPDLVRLCQSELIIALTCYGLL